ncbi:MAG TPA: hypothetical protein VGY54_22745 [Polyangiaceae bacterium]|nr:hypothetical protein [Polyangiaceae bacterium]
MSQVPVLRSLRRHPLLAAALVTGAYNSAGCSGRVTRDSQGPTSGTSGSNVSSSSSGGQPPADATAPVDCSGIAVPQTAYACPSGAFITGRYVPDNGACVLVYDCPPPAMGTAPEAGGPPTVPMNDASSTTTGACASSIGPCKSVYDAGTIGSTIACGDAGLSCTCPSDYFPPAPCNVAGQQILYAAYPPPAPLTSYSNQVEFDALAVGRWRRIAGEAELQCEEVGIEITAQHTWMPLVIATDGSVQAAQGLARPIGLVFNGGTPSIPGNNAPVFFDACPGQIGLQLIIDPWPADYVKMP